MPASLTSLNNSILNKSAARRHTLGKHSVKHSTQGQGQESLYLRSSNTNTNVEILMPLMWPRLNSWAWCHIWVVGSLTCSEGFSQETPGFLSLPREKPVGKPSVNHLRFSKYCNLFILIPSKSLTVFPQLTSAVS